MMARDAGTIDVSMPRIMRGFTLRVRFAKLAGTRLWLATRIMRFAAFVAGCAVEIDTDGNHELRYGADGIPRALSITSLHKGYHRDAVQLAYGLIIKRDGVEVADVISYDIDAGRVSTYARTDAGAVAYLRMGEGQGSYPIEHHKGVVTVERKPT
jgi:hypothetical protein